MVYPIKGVCRRDRADYSTILIDYVGRPILINAKLMAYSGLLYVDMYIVVRFISSGD